MIMKDQHYNYTKDQIKKHLILLEDHLKSNPCSDCIQKHISAIEGYAEEGTLQTDSETEKMQFLQLAEKARELRKSLDSLKIAELTKKLQKTI